MERGQINFHPIISSIQKIALYETKSNFYLVGSNNTQTRFRVLKIDRTEPRELVIYDDKVEYTQQEIQDLICMIDSGNRHGFTNVTSAFGIVGFIRFLEGYYIILVTRRTRAAVIGHHTIYKIEYTSMIYIPHDSVRLLHPDEPRYLKMFQAIDLSSNFYFSYSYDLTHTLQNNLSCPRQIIPNVDDENDFKDEDVLKTSIFPVGGGGGGDGWDIAIRAKPNRKFVWNTHLLSKVEKDLHPDWLLYITHGFIGQSNMSVFGRSIYVTLIARRSCKYAGTRFLKRGANFQGDVANEVETEQMVHDSGVSSLNQSYFTSFVQMRGSIPSHWRQEMGKMVAKPTITLDMNDPFAETAGAHFNELLKRYGSPTIVLNLVKQHEKKLQEKLLSDEFSGAIKYLNQFLPPEHQIQYKTFDMARKNKTTSNVMSSLAGIARSAVLKTGFFHNQPHYYAQNQQTIVGQINRKNTSKHPQNDLITPNIRGTMQTGIIRTNCVDCLDRTNTAQFAIGKCALGYQLCALGILDSPNLEFDTDCVRMLESLYEDHGDTLALQYGGSQLVHRIKTYRKTAPWTSQGNDIMQTLSRYYSNTFSDAEKQNTINLFLGLFIPDETKPQIWEHTSDYYFHFKPNLEGDRLLTQWWDDGVFKCLPYAYNDIAKACSEIIQVQSKEIEMIDAYADYHRPYQLSILNEVFAYKICNSIRDFMPNCTTNYSPFTIRVRPGRRREESYSKNANMKNPSLTGQSSTSSTTSSTSTDSSECSDSSDDETSLNTNESAMSQSRDSNGLAQVKFQSLFPSIEQVYGTELVQPKNSDMRLYKRYVLEGRKAVSTSRSEVVISLVEKLQRTPIFKADTSFKVEPPVVMKTAINAYQKYIKTGICGGFTPKEKDMRVYNDYVNFNFNFLH